MTEDEKQPGPVIARTAAACPSGIDDDRPAAIVVAGPTASGKSALALDLAEALDGVIINADSMQVYRDLDILTARPGPDALARAPHRLYGMLEPSPPCSAGKWRDLALAEIAAAEAVGRRAILVGGTGLYLRALTDGIVAVPDIPSKVRADATAIADRDGVPALHRDLGGRDPKMAATLRPTDRQRVIRAWEVVVATGRSLADWQAAPPTGPAAPPTRWVVVMPERADLHAACDRRFAAMMDQGALDEVARLRGLDLDPALPVMKALGVPQLMRALSGASTLTAAVAEAQAATRQYAKRQVTWLRHQVMGAKTSQDIVAVISAQYSQQMRHEIITKFRERR